MVVVVRLFLERLSRKFVDEVWRSFAGEVGHASGNRYRRWSSRLRWQYGWENLSSLDQRRIIDDLVLCYKIVYNLVDVDVDVFFFQLASSTTRRKRGHCKKLRKPLCNAFIAGTYWHRVINIWNALPDTVVTAPTVYFIQETFMSRWH